MDREVNFSDSDVFVQIRLYLYTTMYWYVKSHDDVCLTLSHSSKSCKTALVSTPIDLQQRKK